MTTQAGDLLTVREAAARLRVHPSLIYRLVHTPTGNRLGSVRIGQGRGRLRIPESAIAEYLERAAVAPPAPLRTTPPRPKSDPAMWSGRLRL